MLVDVVELRDNGGKQQKNNVRVNSSNVLWVRKTQGAEIGKTQIALLGGKAGNSGIKFRIVSTDNDLAAIFVIFGGQPKFVKELDLGNGSGRETYIFPEHVRLIRPIDKHFSIEFSDGSGINAVDLDKSLI